MLGLRGAGGGRGGERGGGAKEGIRSRHAGHRHKGKMCRAGGVCGRDGGEGRQPTSLSTVSNSKPPMPKTYSTPIWALSTRWIWAIPLIDLMRFSNLVRSAGDTCTPMPAVENINISTHHTTHNPLLYESSINISETKLEQKCRSNPDAKVMVWTSDNTSSGWQASFMQEINSLFTAIWHRYPDESSMQLMVMQRMSVVSELSKSPIPSANTIGVTSLHDGSAIGQQRVWPAAMITAEHLWWIQQAI